MGRSRKSARMNSIRRIAQKLSTLPNSLRRACHALLIEKRIPYQCYKWYLDKYFHLSENNGIYEIKTREKTYKFNADPQHDLFPFLGYMKRYQPKKSDIILDCGAYIGVYSIMISDTIGNDGKIICFEPDTKNYKRLLKNIEMNNTRNIVPVNVGLWSKKTSLKFSNCGKAVSQVWEDSILQKRETKVSDDELIEVDVDSLDNQMHKLGIKKIDFIKMDVEGSEVEVIRGAKNLLRENNVNLAVASYHVIEGKSAHILVEKELEKIGYRAKTGFIDHLTTYANSG